MGYTRFSQLTEPSVLPGYDLRPFRHGDEDAWIALLNTGDFGVWDRPRLRRMLAGERAPLPLEGIYFITKNNQPVGTSCVFFHPSDHGDIPELGWVAVHPAQRGRGLGLLLCQAALCFVRDRGYRYMYLKTEDFRLAAIKTYLRLGFEPELTDPSHVLRWQVLRDLLSGSSKEI
jgi:mycothiol synthase